jgi:hypothetical protein
MHHVQLGGEILDARYDASLHTTTVFGLAADFRDFVNTISYEKSMQIIQAACWYLCIAFRTYVAAKGTTYDIALVRVPPVGLFVELNGKCICGCVFKPSEYTGSFIKS